MEEWNGDKHDFLGPALGFGTSEGSLKAGTPAKGGSSSH